MKDAWSAFGTLGLIVWALLATQAACTNVGTTVQTVAADVATACSVASQAAGIAKGTVKGGALATVDNLTAYVTGACGTAEAVAAVAQQPGTVAWLNQIAGGLGALTQAAKGD